MCSPHSAGLCTRPRLIQAQNYDVLSGHQRTALAAGQARGLGITAHCRARSGARLPAPRAHRAARLLRPAAIREPRHLGAKLVASGQAYGPRRSLGTGRPKAWPSDELMGGSGHGRTRAARAELARETANKKMIRQGTTGVAGLTFILVTALGAPHNPALAVTVAALLTCFVTVLTAGLLTLLSWAMDRRSGAQGAGGAGGARPVHGSPPGTADQQGRQPELGQDPPGTVQAAGRRPHRLATSPA